MSSHSKASHVPASTPHIIHIIEANGWLGHYQWISWWFNLSGGYPWLEIVDRCTYQKNVISPSFSQDRVSSYGGVTSLLEEPDEKVMNRKQVIAFGCGRISYELILITRCISTCVTFSYGPEIISTGFTGFLGVTKLFQLVRHINHQ
jgi:hypothetical protein